MKIIHILLLLVASTCFGQTNIAELRIKDRVLKNARFGSATPADVIIYHDCGIAKVALADLPPAYQTNFTFSPSEAKDYTETGKKIAALKREIEVLNAKIAAEKTLEKTMQVYDDGIKDQKTEEKIRGRVIQVIDETKSLLAMMDENPYVADTTTIMLKNFSGGVDDSYKWTTARLVGTYRYETVNHSVSTIPLYDCGAPYVSEKIPELREQVGRLNKELLALKNPQTTVAK